MNNHSTAQTNPLLKEVKIQSGNSKLSKVHEKLSHLIIPNESKHLDMAIYDIAGVSPSINRTTFHLSGGLDRFNSKDTPFPTPKTNQHLETFNFNSTSRLLSQRERFVPNSFEKLRVLEQENEILKARLLTTKTDEIHRGGMITYSDRLQAAIIDLQLQNAKLKITNAEMKEIDSLSGNSQEISKSFSGGGGGGQIPEFVPDEVYRDRLELKLRNSELERKYANLQQLLGENKSIKDLQNYRSQAPILEKNVKKLFREKERLQLQVERLARPLNQPE